MAKPVNPFDELERLFERMEANVEEAARWWESEPFGQAPETAGVRIDLEDRDEAYVLTADLPGFEQSDIDVRLTDRTLHLEAEHAESSETRDGEFVTRERHRAAVSRSVTLPAAVEAEDVDANYANGVLTVTLPKSEPAAEAREIEID